MIFNPYVLAGLLLAFLITFGAGYHNGYQYANNHAEALKLQAVAKAQEQAAEQAKADQQTAQVYEAARETVRTVYVKIKEKAHENIEKHHDYADCGLDADGLRLYNANPNHPERTTPGAGRAVPGFTGGDGWQIGDDLAKQPGALATVLRLPSAAQSALTMGATAAGATEIARADR